MISFKEMLVFAAFYIGAINSYYIFYKLFEEKIEEEEEEEEENESHR